jgi:hypothetical protein
VSRHALCVALLLLAGTCRADDPPTQLPPVEVEGRKNLLDSDRPRLEKLVPCIGDCEGQAIAERKSLVEKLLGVLDIPTLSSQPNVDVPLKAPTKARLDDKLP